MIDPQTVTGNWGIGNHICNPETSHGLPYERSRADRRNSRPIFRPWAMLNTEKARQAITNSTISNVFSKQKEGCHARVTAANTLKINNGFRIGWNRTSIFLPLRK